jgi:hypothetical protein
MSVHLAALDFRPAAMGALGLRRRRQLSSGVDVGETKPGDEFLMSSLFAIFAGKFATSDAHAARLDDPLQNRDASNTFTIGV